MYRSIIFTSCIAIGGQVGQRIIACECHIDQEAVVLCTCRQTR